MVSTSIFMPNELVDGWKISWKVRRRNITLKYFDSCGKGLLLSWYVDVYYISGLLDFMGGTWTLIIPTKTKQQNSQSYPEQRIKTMTNPWHFYLWK